MDSLSPAPPPVITSTPASVLRTGVSAFDDRFGGGARGELIVVSSADRAHLTALAALGAREAAEAGCSVAWADFGSAEAWAALRARVPNGRDAVQRLPQPAPVHEVVRRVEWLRSDPSLEVLIVVDLPGIRSPKALALRALKLLANRERMLVLVAAVHGPRGTGLGAFGELPEAADVLMHVEPKEIGPMFAPAYHLRVCKARPFEPVYHLRVCKARPFEPVTLPVRWDVERGLVAAESTG